MITRPGRIELLSPAGSIEAVKAAVCNGADAVYLGAAFFGARSSVGFSEAQLKEAVRFCHLHKRRVHVTVNTLIKECEFPDIIRTLQMLDDLNADALIIQDIGLFDMIRQRFPRFQLHLSTQMTIHNQSGARFAKQVGADRIVLARECDMDTIRSVCAEGIETEVFAHGAMCVCVSGQCLFSSAIGARSGNRGRCAQPCRMEYEYLKKSASWLSPRDLCVRDRLPQLIAAGVSSLKIEGRLKRPEYVAIVTAAYRKAIDSVYDKRFEPADEDEKTSLRQIFSRGGFTRGYAFGAEDAGILYPDRVTPEGIVIGRTEKCFNKGGTPLCDCRLSQNLNNGDYLEIGSQNIIYSGPDTQAGNTVLLRLHKTVAGGLPVRRMQDESQLQRARRTYAEPEKVSELQIPFDACITAYPGKEIRLVVSARGISTEQTGDIVEAAKQKPIDAESLRRSVAKCGGTFYCLNNFIAHTENAFVPASAVNDLRRKALQMLTESLIKHFEDSGNSHAPALSPAQESIRHAQLLFVATQSPSLVAQLLSGGADRVIYMPADYRRPALENTLKQLPSENVYIALPLFANEEAVQNALSAAMKYGFRIAVRNAGQLIYTEDHPGAITIDGVPVFNAHTADFLKSRHISRFAASPEITRDEIQCVSPCDSASVLVTVYGHQRMMTLSHCPRRVFQGCEKGKNICTLCDQGKGTNGSVFTDKFGLSYSLSPVRFESTCRVDLYHPVAIDLSAYMAEILEHGHSVLLSFTSESAEQQLSVLDRFRGMFDSKKSGIPLSTNTGHYLTGVD